MASAQRTRTLRYALIGAAVGILMPSLSGCSLDGDASMGTEHDAQGAVGEYSAVEKHREALLTDNALEPNRLAANRLAANRIALNKLSANRLAANKLATNKLATNRIAFNRLAANRLAANKLATNRLAANRLAAKRLAANRLAANALTANRIAVNGLRANLGALSEPVNRGLAADLENRRGALPELEASGFDESLEGKHIEFALPEADYVALPDLVTHHDPLSFSGKDLVDFDPAEFELSELDSVTQDKLLLERTEIDADSVGTLLTTEDGREVMKYMVSCALGENQTLVGSFEGSEYEFEGSLGLASGWTQSPLSLTDQRWVSACLFARVNAHGISVEVSLRGSHPQLDVSAEEMATWSLEEGAFWGNLFAPGDTIDWNACEGLDQLEGEQGALQARDCTEPDTENPGFTLCGLKSAGACSSLAAQTACRSFDTAGTYYSDCAADGAAAASEVITTFVRATP